MGLERARDDAGLPFPAGCIPPDLTACFANFFIIDFRRFGRGHVRC